jgi:hypothetical protein
VDLADIREIGQVQGRMWRYEIIWRQGPQQMTGNYTFPTKKPLAKVLALAKAEC